MAALLVGALDRRGVLGRHERTGCRREEALKLGATHRNSEIELGTPNPEKKLRCVASGLRIPTRSFESGKQASMRRIGTPYSNSELRIRERRFDASHRYFVFQLGASNPEKKLRCVASGLRISTRSFESRKEASMHRIG